MTYSQASKARFNTGTTTTQTLPSSKLWRIPYPALQTSLPAFADGSQESVAAVAGMAAAGSPDELAAIVGKWRVLQAQQKEAAGQIADYNILAEYGNNFTEELDSLDTELQLAVTAMDYSDDAAESARETIQGFIDGAEDMLPEVQGRL